MKKFYSVVIVMLLVLVWGTIMAGCIQSSKVSQVQPTGTTTSPTQTAGQSGGGPLQETPAISTTNSYDGQNYNPPQTSEPQKTYVVAATVSRFGSSLTFTYQGGQDAASLQSITIFENGDYVAYLSAGTGQTSLPIGSKTVFRAVDTAGSTNHIVAMGRFTGGATQIILDTTI